MEEEHHHQGFWSQGLKHVLGTTEAREIGYLYFILAFINASFAGLYAILIRTELWTPQADFFNDGLDYAAAFTLHGTVMVFLVVVPLGAGMGNYLLPRMVASMNDDMYWPKWNNVAFWMLPIGSIFVWLSQAPIGWTAYAPLSVTFANPGIDLWILGLVITGVSGTIGSINFILTTWKGRDPTIGWMQLDLFVWGTFLTSILLLLSTPSIVIAIVLIFFDRNLKTSFYFSGSLGPTEPIMYQHLFWFFSHPEVYVMVMPAFGLISVMVAKFSRREIFGYNGMVAAFISIGALSFMVWAHHMYATGINPLVRVAFTTMTFVIAIPSGVKIFNWLTTLYNGRIKFELPMLFSLSFIIMFTLGGITGVYVNIVPIDITLHDTYWVVGHFHFVVAAGSLSAFFGAFYYYFPDMTGKYANKTLGTLNFWFWSIGNLIAFTGFTLLGMYGMPRRYYTYPIRYEGLHRMATVGAYLMGIGFLFFIIAMFHGYFKGKPVEDFDNLFDIGSGYDFPTPFAERMQKEEGVDVHVVHSDSLWAASAGFALTLPMFAFLGIAKTGIFSDRYVYNVADGFDGLDSISKVPIMEVVFMAALLAIWIAVLIKAKGSERTPAILTTVILFVELLSILGYLDLGSPSDTLGPIGFVLMALFLLWVGFFFYAESHVEKPAQLIDGYKKGRNWEIWTFLSSETIFFGILIGVGLALKANYPPGSGAWPNKPDDVLNVPITAVNTFVLIISSFTMAKGVESIKKGDIEKLKQYLLATIILGVIFISVQFYEYTHLVETGIVALGKESVFKPNNMPIYSSAFFLQTGFHGAHVLIGIILLIFVYLRARAGGYSKENHEYIEFVGLYWHFVDLVWIVLFTVVYLI